MVIKADGKVGIGTANPDAELHIQKLGDSLGNIDLLHLSVGSVTAESNISIKSFY
jgi:hypothetical protein